MHLKNIFKYGSLYILVFSSLLNSGFFGNQNLVPFFSFALLSALFLLANVKGNLAIAKKGTLILEHTVPVWLLLLLTVFYCLHSVMREELNFNLKHIYLICSVLMLFALSIEFRKNKKLFLHLAIAITLAALLEIAICFFQFFHIISSANTFFKVTGSCSNPNETGMFLTMSIPAILTLITNVKRWLKIMGYTCLGLCPIVLLMLGTRTAAIGIAIISFVLVLSQCHLLNAIRKQVSKRMVIALAILSVFLLAIFFQRLFIAKQASSEGRLFVWKVSMYCVKNKPLFGAGLGMFDHDYNLSQADYFLSGKSSKSEIHNASYIQVSYNEFILNIVEGGIVALVIFSLFLLALFARSISVIKSNPRPTTDEGRDALFAASGVLAFIGMSFVNFTFNAVPVLLLFIIYAGHTIGQEKVAVPISAKGNFLAFINRLKVTYVHLLSVATISVFMLLSVLVTAKSYRTESLITSQNVDKKNYREFTSEMKKLRTSLKSSPTYWAHLANVQYKMKFFKSAAESYRKATNLCSDPNYYFNLGNCYMQLRLREDAIRCYSTSVHIQPNRFVPRLALMNAYADGHDTLKALGTAKEIISLEPKVPSAEVTSCKEQARQFIQKNDSI